MNVKILLVFILFLLSCQSNHQATQCEKILINDVRVEDIPFENAFKSVKFVSIDSNMVFVPGASKILYKNETIFLSDNFRIYIYDVNGKIIGDINKRGRANDEYSEITDFDIINDEIVVLDRTQRKILLYNLHGKLISTINLNVFASKIVVSSDSTILLNNDYSDYEESKNGKLTHININNKQTTYFGTFNKNKTNYMHVMGGTNFYKSKDGEILFYENFSPYVYKVSDNKMEIINDIRFNNSPDDNFFDLQYEDIADFMKKFNQNNYASGISNLYGENNRIIFKYNHNGKEYYCCYNIEKKDVEYAGSFILYGQIKINNIFFNENCAIANISAYRLIDAAEKSEQIAALVKKYNISEKSCPLLILIDKI